MNQGQVEKSAVEKLSSANKHIVTSLAIATAVSILVVKFSGIGFNEIEAGALSTVLFAIINYIEIVVRHLVGKYF